MARSALVMHSAEDMYALVNDIDSYAAFLPWCGDSKVLSRDADEMVARIRIAYQGIGQSFTTRNRLTPPRTIEMTLVDGPFSALSGTWRFTPLRVGACRIALDLRFDFANAAVGAAVGPVFRRIADSMVDSFVRRADALAQARAPE